MRIPVEFVGVDGVRVNKIADKTFAVESQWLPPNTLPAKRVDWYVLKTFATLDEAIEQAPYLCNF